MRPCKRCGGPKPPGQGIRYCVPCARIVKKQKYEQNHPLKPCQRCGGPKAERTKGVRHCPECAKIIAAESEERRRIWDAERKRKERASETKKLAARPTAPTSRKVSTIGKGKVPADIRNAWARAHHNSQIRRLCPTKADLVARFGT